MNVPVPLSKTKQEDHLRTNGYPCRHCGEPCGHHAIHHQGEVFCCMGCKTVFELLQTNQLENAHCIRDRPGESPKSNEHSNYEYLDDPEIKSKLIHFSEGSLVKVSFFFPQIHCSSCVWLLENAYQMKTGILSGRINFLKKEGTFLIDETVLTLKELVEFLASIGYAPQINYSSQSGSDSSVDTSLYYKLGLAGFAFGNIMLFSFPEYLGLETSSFQKWFGYLNIILAIPVLFYAGGGYLKSAWHSLLRNNLNMDVPIALGMITLFGRSTYEILSQTGAGYMDSLAGLVFFLLIGKWFQQATYSHLNFERDYQSYFPIAVTIKQNQEWVMIPLRKVQIGDILLVRNQELITHDGEIIKGKGRIDYSFVTGEADKLVKNIGDTVFAGGKQMGQAIEIKVTKKIEQSYLTQLWNESAFHQDNNGEQIRFANQTGKYFTFIILFIAFSTLLFWMLNNPSLAINAFTAVLIIACPCAIALSIPFTYGNVQAILAKHQLFIKHINVVEAIQSIQHIVFDKTGTLTSSEQQKIEYHGSPLNSSEKQAIRTLAHQSAHPLSRKIDLFYQSFSLDELSDFAEIEGKGIQAFINGQFIKLGSPEFVGAQPKGGQTSVWVSVDEKVVGYFLFNNPFRDGLEENFESMRENFQLSLLSGDNDKEKERFTPLFRSGGALHFLQSPLEKLNYVKKLQQDGQKVMMIGDGLNDAGALKQSDVGMVITENINNFTPASDAILAASQFSLLYQILKFVKQSKNIIWFTYGMAIIYNIIGLSFAVQGTLSPVIAAILMPLSSISVVITGVGLSSLLARRIFTPQSLKGSKH